MSEEHHKLEMMDYLYGELTDSEEKSFLEALEQDVELETDLRSLESTRSLYAEVELPEPGAALSQAILRQEKILRQPAPSLWASLQKLLFTPAIGLTTAAVIFVAGGTSLFYSLGQAPNSVSEAPSPVATSAEASRASTRAENPKSTTGIPSLEPKSKLAPVASPKTKAKKEFAAGKVGQTATQMDKKQAASPQPQTAHPKKAPRQSANKAAGDTTRKAKPQKDRRKAQKNRSQTKRENQPAPLAASNGVDAIALDESEASEDDNMGPSDVSIAGATQQIADSAEEKAAPEFEKFSNKNVEAKRDRERRGYAPQPDQQPEEERQQARQEEQRIRGDGTSTNRLSLKRSSSSGGAEHTPFRAGMEAYRNRRYQDALTHFDLATRQTTGPNAKIMKARSLMKLKRYNEAAKLYDQVLEKYPNYDPKKRTTIAQELVNCYRAMRQESLAKKARQRFADDLAIEAPAEAVEAEEAPASAY